MENNNQADSEKVCVFVNNLKWLSGEVNKNFNIGRIIKLMKEINIGVKELKAK
jgi:hypothetical protein|nr:MAG TPA: hypothetical protein [Bacteriophage sp.]